MRPSDSFRSRGRRDRAFAALSWALAWLVTAALVAAVQYSSRDPDSRLYAGISARLVERPITSWIAPEWWGLWGFTGPYHEHPVGMFVSGAVLGRAGYPAEQAAYAVNGLFQILSFVLIAGLAASVIGIRDARALGWMLQLLPIAFVFRIRANQEYAVLLGLLFAVYATERARHRPMWTLGMLAGFSWVLLVKGVFAFVVPLTCMVWLAARINVSAPAERTWRSQSGVRRFAPWLAVLAMPLVGAAIVAGYEAAYVHATGRSFLDVYRARQMPEGALTGGSPVVRTAYNLVWYLSRVLWFALPWSLSASALLIRSRRPESGRTDEDEGSGHAARRQGAWFAIVSSLILVAVFSAAHRKAERYIFPVYFFIGAVGAVAAIERSPRLVGLVRRLDQPWVPAAVYVGLFLLRLVTAGQLPEFTFWRT